MKTEDSPSLIQYYGVTGLRNRHDKDGTVTIITNNYLKDIREELLEERDNIIENNKNGNNGIVQIKADINGIDATLLIDTGSNVSLIDLSLIHI